MAMDLRKMDKSVGKNKHWTGIHCELEREEDRSKPEKEQFWRKQENVKKKNMVWD
jgi:hypothetical protein